MSGEFTGAAGEETPTKTNSAERTFTTAAVSGNGNEASSEQSFVTSPVEQTDQLVSSETTFQTLPASRSCEGRDCLAASEEGTITTLADDTGGGGGGNNDDNGSSGGGGGGRRRRPPAVVTPLAPTVIAAAPVPHCPIYLTKFIRLGRANDPLEVLKLQYFLRDRQGFANVLLSGVYDLTTYEAVKVFQVRYGKDILKPWGIDYPTGYVYITTTLAINNLYCERDPATTLDLRHRFTPSGVESAATATSTPPAGGSTSTPTLEFGEATSTPLFLTAALGTLNFFKLIPYWWWTLVFLIIISYLIFALRREKRRYRSLASFFDEKKDNSDLFDNDQDLS